MTLRTRREFISPKDTVQLTATFKGTDGLPIDTDSFPQITIVTPDGLVSVGPTSAGMMRLGVGHYQFNYDIGFTGPLGVWSDVWVGLVQGFRVEATFDFVVVLSDQPALNTDGYYHLGDDVGFDYSQLEIFNINKLLKTLRARLNSRGKTKSKDAFGNVIYVDCDIYTVDTMVALLANSITIFNEIPHWTMFTFADTQFLDQFHEILVEGAVLWALASQALIERGREAVITDNGISFTPPTVSELLNTQWSTALTAYNDRLKFIKNSFKPHPLGLGRFSMLNSPNPQIRNLRLLRARQIF